MSSRQRLAAARLPRAGRGGRGRRGDRRRPAPVRRRRRRHGRNRRRRPDPDALGSGWSLDATVDLGGPDDVGLLSGCALTGGLAGDDPGTFTALSDGSGDAITSEVRVGASAAHAAEVFDAATSIDALECVRSAVESQAVSQLAPSTPAAVIEPLQTTPWAEQAMAYRVQVDVDGLPAQHTDVHIIRSGPAIGGRAGLRPG